MNVHLVLHRLALSAALLGLLTLIHPWPALGQALGARRFESELEQHARRYADLAEADDARQLLISGDIDGYHNLLLREVPDSEKTFYDYFILANLLFTEDPEQSYRYMLTAEALDPSNPFAWFERGIHEHRRGNCEAAMEYYRRLHDEQGRFANPVSWAYRTHCALRIGEFDEAIQAWRQADFPNHHTAIEKGMYVIFSESRPHTRRQEILARISGGAHEAFCDLLHHDRNWEIDWWNETTQDEFLAFDTALADAVITEGSDDAAAIRLCLDAPELGDSEFDAALRSAGHWGENASLPESEALIYDMVVRLTSAGLADPADVLDRLGAQMWERFGDGNAGRPLLEVMGFLYSSTGDSERLRAVDAYGWRELKLERFAASYLLGTDPTADAYEPLLEEAVTDFPNSAIVHRLVLTSVMDSPDRDATLASYVAAEFANVKENWAGPYRLSDFMASLQREIGSVQP